MQIFFNWKEMASSKIVINNGTNINIYVCFLYLYVKCNNRYLWV